MKLRLVQTQDEPNPPDQSCKIQAQSLKFRGFGYVISYLPYRRSMTRTGSSKPYTSLSRSCRSKCKTISRRGYQSPLIILVLVKHANGLQHHYQQNLLPRHPLYLVTGASGNAFSIVIMCNVVDTCCMTSRNLIIVQSDALHSLKKLYLINWPASGRHLHG